MDQKKFKRMKSDADYTAGLRARNAWQNIKKGWTHWTKEIGPWLLKAREEAMMLAVTNQPIGSSYSKAMSEILEAYELDDINETARANLLRIMENLPAVEEWRMLQDNGTELNNPSTVWRKYQHSSKQQDAKDVERKAGIRDQVAALDEENEQLKAEIEDLKAARDFEAATIQPQDDDAFIAGLSRRPRLRDATKQERHEEVIEQLKRLLKELHELEQEEAESVAPALH